MAEVIAPAAGKVDGRKGKRGPRGPRAPSEFILFKTVSVNRKGADGQIQSVPLYDAVQTLKGSMKEIKAAAGEFVAKDPETVILACRKLGTVKAKVRTVSRVAFEM